MKHQCSTFFRKKGASISTFMVVLHYTIQYGLNLKNLNFLLSNELSLLNAYTYCLVYWYFH